MRTIECGDPKDPNTAMGPVISAKQLAHVMEQVGTHSGTPRVLTVVL